MQIVLLRSLQHAIIMYKIHDHSKFVNCVVDDISNF